MPRDIDAAQEARLQAGVAAGAGDHHPCHSVQHADAPPARWACVYTHSQAERWADANLRRIGYQTYLPLVAVLKRDRVTPSLRHEALVPLFPRYLFIRFDASAESWSPIRAAPGVVDLVRSGSGVHYARAGAVEALEATEAIRATPLPTTPQWAPGMPCSLGTGPFRGVGAVVLAVRGERALVGMMVLGGLREARTSLHNLRVREV